MTRLFVSDLDGTLLDASGQLSDVTRAELLRLLADGLRFTVATARSIHTLAPILEGIPLSLPVIELNGAAITDLRTRRSLGCHGLEPQVAEDVMRWGLVAGVAPFACTYVEGEQRLYPPAQTSNAGSAWYLETRLRARDPRLRPAVELSQVLRENVVFVNLIARRHELAPIEERLQATHPSCTQTLLYENKYDPGWYWLTVQSALATKERALRELAERFGHGLAGVTVFGDEINDIPMFRAAGHAVAVDNAVPELKRIAHEVIGPHHEHSVARYLASARGVGW